MKNIRNLHFGAHHRSCIGAQPRSPTNGFPVAVLTPQQQRSCDTCPRLQSLKYLLPGPLQKKFANLYSNTKKGGRGGIQLGARENGGKERNKKKRKGRKKREYGEEGDKILLSTYYVPGTVLGDLTTSFLSSRQNFKFSTSSRGKICDQEASIPRGCASSEHLLSLGHPAPSPAIKAHSSDPAP